MGLTPSDACCVKTKGSAPQSRRKTCKLDLNEAFRTKIELLDEVLGRLKTLQGDVCVQWVKLKMAMIGL